MGIINDGGSLAASRSLAAERMLGAAIGAIAAMPQ